RDCWAAYHNRVDEKQRPDGALAAPGASAWASKHAGRVARIGAWLHGAALARQHGAGLTIELLTKEPIPQATVEAASRIGSYFELQGMRANEVREEPEGALGRARLLVGWLLEDWRLRIARGEDPSTAARWTLTGVHQRLRRRFAVAQLAEGFRRLTAAD